MKTIIIIGFIAALALIWSDLRPCDYKVTRSDKFDRFEINACTNKDLSAQMKNFVPECSQRVLNKYLNIKSYTLCLLNRTWLRQKHEGYMRCIIVMTRVKLFRLNLFQKMTLRMIWDLSRNLIVC